MIALLKKDVFVMDKQMRVLVILALIFNLIPSTNGFGSTYAMLIALMLPISTVSYDERCKWDRYAAMLPWSPCQIVGSKYILSCGAFLLGMVLILLGKYAQILYGNTVDWQETLALYLVLIAVMTAVVYPLVYRFGSEKGRLVMVAVFIAIFILGGGLMMVVGLEQLISGMGALPAPVLAVIAAAVVVAGTFLSYRLSVKFYLRRREGAYT